MSRPEAVAGASLDAAVLRSLLEPSARIGREILVLEETASTNDLIAAQTTPATVEGLVVFAERQTAGRGQRGNRWDSAAHKGLWFSVLLRPGIDVRDSARLTDWAAATIAATANEMFAIGATVKPPNDVYVGARKLAGVLVEMRAVPSQPHFAVLGIGINVLHRPEDFPPELRDRAASLWMCTTAGVDRHGVAAALLNALDRTYREIFPE